MSGKFRGLLCFVFLVVLSCALVSCEYIRQRSPDAVTLAGELNAKYQTVDRLIYGKISVDKSENENGYYKVTEPGLSTKAEVMAVLEAFFTDGAVSTYEGVLFGTSDAHPYPIYREKDGCLYLNKTVPQRGYTVVWLTETAKISVFSNVKATLRMNKTVDGAPSDETVRIELIPKESGKTVLWLVDSIDENNS